MVFGSFSDFKVEILFSFWNVKTRAEFALSWLAICCVMIFYHYLKNLSTHVELQIQSIKIETDSSSNGSNFRSGEAPLIPHTDDNNQMEHSTSMTKLTKLIIFSSFVATVNYGVSEMKYLLIYPAHSC